MLYYRPYSPEVVKGGSETKVGLQRLPKDLMVDILEYISNFIYVYPSGLRCYCS